VKLITIEERNNMTDEEKKASESHNQERIRRYEAAKKAISEGKGHRQDYFEVSEWEWDNEPNGDQRR
jgi:hypothetical protein